MRTAGRLGSAALLAMTLLGLGGCTSVKNGLGPHESICFSTIAEARGLVGQKPSFAGVRYIEPTALRRALAHRFHHRIELSGRLGRKPGRDACMIAFRGRLPARFVARSWKVGPGPYRFGIVAVRLDGHRLLGSVVMRRPPLEFGDLG